LLLDVREKVQFNICSLPSSLNIPLKALPNELEKVKARLEGQADRPLYIMCRRGNDSQPAVRILQENGIMGGEAKDIVGGLERWSNTIDPDFPKY
jgi:adenylyltransferase/sulfurtransferase